MRLNVALYGVIIFDRHLTRIIHINKPRAEQYRFTIIIAQISLFPHTIWASFRVGGIGCMQI